MVVVEWKQGLCGRSFQMIAVEKLNDVTPKYAEDREQCPASISTSTHETIVPKNF